MNFNYTEFNKITMKLFGTVIPNNIIDSAISIGNERIFKKDEIILGIGEPMKKVYFILKGIARSYYLDVDGNDVTKAFLLEMNFCVAESFFSDEPSCQGFEALDDMCVIEFNASDLKNYMLSNSVLKEVYIKFLEQTILYKMRRASSFQLQSSMERYLNLKKEFPNLEDRVKQSFIASYSGITPVSLSRIRRALREEI